MTRRLLIGILIFSIFVALSYFVQKKAFTAFDFDTTVRLQDHISRRFDTILSAWSLFGSVEFLAIILLIFLVIKRNLGLLILLPISFIGIHIFEIFGKLFVRHLGPPFMFLRYNINFLFPSSYVEPGYSYPSGHAARSMFVTVILLYFLLKSKKIGKSTKAIVLALAVFFDLGMLISRVYLGEHWASDVMGGSVLGLALGFLTIAFF